MSKPQRGRPLKGQEAMMNPITVRFPPVMMDAIEAIRAARFDQPEKGQVIRELVAKGIDAERKARK